MPKRVTLTVECTVELDNDVEPNSVVFDIPIELVKVKSLDCKPGKQVGKLLSYCTQEYHGE